MSNMNRRLDDRYELLDEMPHVTGGRLFRARDLAFGEIVGVKLLGPDCGLELEARQHLENTVRHLQCLPHPHLARVYAFDERKGLIVQEWVQGISLLDLLRRRRELSVSEALHLLTTLPATLDFLAREAVPIPRPLLGKLFVEFGENVAADGLVATPLDRWPAFRLKLNPLSLRGLLSDPTGDDTKHTIVLDPRRPTEIQEGYGPREFALLLYELLGGRIREVDSRRYSPLSSLHEAGNSVLRRELLAMPHADCASVWRDLLQAEADANRIPPISPQATAAAVRTSHIPESFLSVSHPGTVLNLDSYAPETPPMHFATGPRFTVGRSATADFIARILPENERNEARTNRLSRVHSVLEIDDGAITLRDGNGSGPSLNGSSLDGQPLTPNHPAVLPHRGRLVLGDEYAMDLIPLNSTESPAWEIDNLDAWKGPAGTTAAPLPYRALACEPVEGHGITRHGVWLFSEAGFGVDAAERIVWDNRGRGHSPAAFHYYRGCFWLRNDSLSVPVFVDDDTLLCHGEILPLASSQIIRIGSHTFCVQIE